MTRGVTVTVTLATPGGHNEYGDPVDPDEGSPSTATLEGCAVAPVTSDESDDRGRHGTLTALDLYSPTASPVLTEKATVTIPAGHPHAGTWRVEGEPAGWQSPYTGQTAGVVARLVKAVG